MTCINKIKEIWMPASAGMTPSLFICEFSHSLASKDKFDGIEKWYREVSLTEPRGAIWAAVGCLKGEGQGSLSQNHLPPGRSCASRQLLRSTWMYECRERAGARSGLRCPRTNRAPAQSWICASLHITLPPHIPVGRLRSRRTWKCKCRERQDAESDRHSCIPAQHSHRLYTTSQPTGRERRAH